MEKNKKSVTDPYCTKRIRRALLTVGLVIWPLAATAEDGVIQGAALRNQNPFLKRELEVSAFAGVVVLGDGDVLSEIQRSAVPYGGIAATWWMTERFGIARQLYGQGAYFDSEIDELGGESAQFAVGFDYRLPQSGLSLLFSIVEDVVPVTTTTPDFAVHFSVRKSPMH